MAPAKLIMRLENRLPEIQRFVEAALTLFDDTGVPRTLGLRCVLATDEMLTNIISYAWPMGGKHLINLRLLVDEGAVTVELTDDGQPFNPLEAATPDNSLALEDRRIGGLGIHVARQAMDELHYARTSDHNQLIMTKRTKERNQADGSA